MPFDYQVMPALSEEDFEALKVDISKHGVLVPVEYDDEGHVLDGHHRIKACRALGIDEWPRIERKGLSDEQKRQHARALNMARRHLTAAQKRELIAAQLKETPEVSNRQIAAALKVNHETVQAVRAVSEATGEIRQLKKTVGADGKSRQRPKLSSVTSDPEFRALAEESARDLEIERDERIALSGTGALADENAKLTKQVAALTRRVSALISEKGAAEYREKMWKERAIAAGWKVRADA